MWDVIGSCIRNICGPLVTICKFILLNESAVRMEVLTRVADVDDLESKRGTDKLNADVGIVQS